jgi:hypothetical protein
VGHENFRVGQERINLGYVVDETERDRRKVLLQFLVKGIPKRLGHIEQQKNIGHF